VPIGERAAVACQTLVGWRLVDNPAPLEEHPPVKDTSPSSPIFVYGYAAVVWVGLNLGAWQLLAPYLDASPLWMIVLVATIGQVVLIPLTKVAGLVVLTLCQPVIVMVGLVLAAGIGVLVFTLKFFGLEGLAEKWRFDRDLARGDIMGKLRKKSARRRKDDSPT